MGDFRRADALCVVEQVMRPGSMHASGARALLQWPIVALFALLAATRVVSI